MDIDIGDIGGSVTCLRVYGPLDGSAGPMPGSPWDGVPGARARDAAVDLSRVSSVSADGLRWLLAAQQALRARGRSLVLFGAPPDVRDTLHRAAIDEVIAVATDEVAAIERLYA